MRRANILSRNVSFRAAYNIEKLEIEHVPVDGIYFLEIFRQQIKIIIKSFLLKSMF